jgi:hypothetical protein
MLHSDNYNDYGRLNGNNNGYLKLPLYKQGGRNKCEGVDIKDLKLPPHALKLPP